MKSIFKTKSIFRGIIKRGIFFDFPLSRGLPKTGQVTSYENYDDGQYEAGWWKGRLNANNKTRFKTKTIDGDEVVVDRATGLMWVANGQSDGCNWGVKKNFADAIVLAEGLTFAGKSDWRIPNIFELFSICDMSQNDPMINTTFFHYTESGQYWTSTTDVASIANAICVDFDEIKVASILKTNLRYLRCVRGGL